MDVTRYVADTNNQTKIEVSEISNYFKVPEIDSNENGIPDPMEIADHALEQQKHESDKFYKQMQESNKLKIEDKKHQQKQKEIETRNSIEEKKIALEKQKLVHSTKIEELKARTALKIAKSRPKSGKK